MEKSKLRKSYLHLANDTDLMIYQYEVMPKKPFVKGTLRSSWFCLDTEQESLDEMITSIMEAYIEDKRFECFSKTQSPFMDINLRKWDYIKNY